MYQANFNADRCPHLERFSCAPLHQAKAFNPDLTFHEGVLNGEILGLGTYQGTAWGFVFQPSNPGMTTGSMVYWSQTAPQLDTIFDLLKTTYQLQS